MQISGKIGRKSVRNPICRFQGKLGWFSVRNKMFRFFLRKPVRFSIKNLNMQILGKIGGFLGEISTKSGIWMKCSHLSHNGFFRTDFRTRVFARFSCDLLFQGSFCSHGSSHVSRVFARFSHDLRFQGFLFARFARVRTIFACRPACLCQIRSKSAQIWKKSLVSIGAPQNF